MITSLPRPTRPRPATPQDGAEPDEVRPRDVVLPVMTRQQFAVLLVVLAVLLAGALALLFGPARGMRDDIGEVQTDLSSSEKGIYGTLGSQRELLSAIRVQLVTAEESLQVQRRGLVVAAAAEQDTTAIRAQTEAALEAVREVRRALGPADELARDVESLVRDADAAVRLGQAALRVAEQALATGQETLAVLRRTEQLQRELLGIARQQLEEVREINRKTPGAPVFPSAR